MSQAGKELRLHLLSERPRSQIRFFHAAIKGIPKRQRRSYAEECLKNPEGRRPGAADVKTQTHPYMIFPHPNVQLHLVALAADDVKVPMLVKSFRLPKNQPVFSPHARPAHNPPTKKVQLIFRILAQFLTQLVDLRFQRLRQGLILPYGFHKFEILYTKRRKGHWKCPLWPFVWMFLRFLHAVNLVLRRPALLLELKRKPRSASARSD
jgi:hypothetical protein